MRECKEVGFETTDKRGRDGVEETVTELMRVFEDRFSMRLF